MESGEQRKASRESRAESREPRTGWAVAVIVASAAVIAIDLFTRNWWDAAPYAVFVLAGLAWLNHRLAWLVNPLIIAGIGLVFLSNSLDRYSGAFGRVMTVTSMVGACLMAVIFLLMLIMPAIRRRRTDN